MIGYEGGALLKGTSDPQSSQPREDTAKRQPSMNHETLSRQGICWCLDLRLPASRAVRNTVLLFRSHLIYSIL